MSTQEPELHVNRKYVQENGVRATTLVMLLFSVGLSGSDELYLAYNKLSVWLVIGVEVRRRTEWEQAHKVL
jgi:hypothetical protein